MISSHSFDAAALQLELALFATLLTKPSFGETEAMDLFRACPNLVGAFGFFSASISSPDLTGVEVSIEGLVRCDFVVGDSKSRNFLLIELEDADTTSIFKRPSDKKKIADWSSRYEHGFSQLVDWSWIMSESSNSIFVQKEFQGEVAKWDLLLIAGRSGALDKVDAQRLRWRSQHAQVHGHHVLHFTFDELYENIVQKVALSRTIT